MTRVKTGFKRRQRHKKVLKLARGFWGARSKLYKKAKEATVKAGEEAFRGRKLRKRDMKTLWIQRINASLTSYSLPYKTFMEGVLKSKIRLNRKMLSELAVKEAGVFGKIVEKVKM